VDIRNGKDVYRERLGVGLLVDTFNSRKSRTMTLWEPTTWTPARRAWWNVVLDTDWVSDSEIQQVVGPEYLMYEDVEAFGANAAMRFP
jgi:hypothetical protein